MAMAVAAATPIGRTHAERARKRSVFIETLPAMKVVIKTLYG
jgi:hypothetical protein